MSQPPRLDPAWLIVPIVALMVAIAGPGRVPIRPPFGAGTPVSPPARVLPDQPPPARLVPARLASTEGDGTGWRWPLPAPGTVARAFQAPEHPYGPGHRGVDLSSVPGGRVEAARDGVVGFAGWIGDRWVVTVVHGSLRTTYEPVRPLVREGEPIAGGQPIGLLESGHPGCPARACLHWGVLRGSEYLDPVAFFRRVPPRLLPLLG